MFSAIHALIEQDQKRGMDYDAFAVVPLPVFRLPIAYSYRGRLERRTFIARRSFFAYRGIYR
jgi:hypothetical protein